MALPCIIDHIISDKRMLALCIIDENAEIFHVVASDFSRIKGYVRFNLNVSASYCKDEQTLSEPFSTTYKASYDRETHVIKVTFETHVTRNPYPSWWECAEKYIVEFIQGSVKNGKWEWRRKHNP
jgi:hypothetical protein